MLLEGDSYSLKFRLGIEIYLPICVSRVWNSIQFILCETHNSRYPIHLGTEKMYCDLRYDYWLSNLKKDIVDYMSHCLCFEQVKAKYLKPYSEF